MGKTHATTIHTEITYTTGDSKGPRYENHITVKGRYTAVGAQRILRKQCARPDLIVTAVRYIGMA